MDQKKGQTFLTECCLAKRQIIARKSCYSEFCKKWEGCGRCLLAPVDVGMCGWTFTSVQCASRLKCSRSAGRRGHASRLETPDPSHYLAHLKLSCTNSRGPTAREQPDPPPRFLVSHPGTTARRRRRGGGSGRGGRGGGGEGRATAGGKENRLSERPRQSHHAVWRRSLSLSSRSEFEWPRRVLRSARPLEAPLADVRPFCWLISEVRGGPGVFSTKTENKKPLWQQTLTESRLMSQNGWMEGVRRKDGGQRPEAQHVSLVKRSQVTFSFGAAAC